jgi:hypothetical protein
MLKFTGWLGMKRWKCFVELLPKLWHFLMTNEKQAEEKKIGKSE